MDMAASVENPLRRALGNEQHPGGDEGKQTPLLQGHFSAEQVVALRSEFAGAEQQSVIASHVQSAVARLTEAPTNWHQAAVYACTSFDPQDSAVRWRLFAGSVTMILFQLTAAVGALRNTQAVSCSSNVQCQVEGMYCEVFSAGVGYSSRQSDRCSYCGRQSPVPLQANPQTGEIWNRPADARGVDNIFSPHLPQQFVVSGHEWWPGESFYRHYNPQEPELRVSVSDEARTNPVFVTITKDAGWNFSTVEWTCSHPDVGLSVNSHSEGIENNRSPVSVDYVRNWCEGCVFLLEQDVNELTEASWIRGNLAAMGAFDWSTLLLASTFLALASVGELKDTYLCTVAVDQSDTLSSTWRRSFHLLSGLRQYVFLPSVLSAVSGLVAVGGGDALSVCLNTIAVLFLYEVDNIAFANLLSEDLRVRVERDGRVKLAPANLRELRTLRQICVPCMSIGLILSILVADWTGNSYFPFIVNFVACWVSALAIEWQVAQREVKERAAALCAETGKMLFASLFFSLLLGLANVL